MVYYTEKGGTNMKLLKRLTYLTLSLIFLTNLTNSQFLKNHDDVSKKDLIDALSLAGIDIIHLDLEKVDRNYTLKVIVDEYAGKGNLINSYTEVKRLIDYQQQTKEGNIEKKYINHLRVISKVTNNSFDQIFLMFSTEKFGKYSVLNIDEEFQRKHYWVPFAKSDFKIGKKIPLLFYGSEWDEIIDGKKVPRFCSLPEMSPDLDDDTVKFIPHFFIMSYVFEETKQQEGQ